MSSKNDKKVSGHITQDEFILFNAILDAKNISRSEVIRNLVREWMLKQDKPTVFCSSCGYAYYSKPKCGFCVECGKVLG